MNLNDYKILENYSKKIRLNKTDIELCLRSLEFYFVVIRQELTNNIIDGAEYDDIYYSIYCLYHCFLYSLNSFDNSYIPMEIPLYKRIDNRVYLEKKLAKYKVV